MTAPSKEARANILLLRRKICGIPMSPFLQHTVENHPYVTHKALCARWGQSPMSLDWCSLCFELWEQGAQHLFESVSHSFVAFVVWMNGIGHVNRLEGDALEDVRHIKNVFSARKIFEMR